MFQGLLIGSVCSQGSGQQYDQGNFGNGLQRGNTPLQNFQSLLPSNMLPTGNEPVSQNNEPRGNLGFATGNINAMSRNELSSGPLPFVPEMNNQMPPFVDTMENQNMPNFDFPQNSGRKDFTNSLPPMNSILLGPENLGPQVLPFPQELPPRQPNPLQNFVPLVRNVQDRQFERVIDKPIFFDAPFSPAFPAHDQINQNLIKDFVEPRFSKPLPFFLEQNRFDTNPSKNDKYDMVNYEYQGQGKDSQKDEYNYKTQPEYSTSTTTVEPTTTEIPTTTTTLPDSTTSSPDSTTSFTTSTSSKGYPGPKFPSYKKSKDPNGSLFPMLDLSPPEYLQKKMMFPKRSRYGSSNNRYARRYKYGGKVGRGQKADCKHKSHARYQKRRDTSSDESSDKGFFHPFFLI